jgi:hypothetical protein
VLGKGDSHSHSNKTEIDANGGHYDDQGHYHDPSGGYYDANGRYYDSHGGYYDEHGYYYDPSGGYYDNSGHYYDKDGGYYDPKGQYYPPVQLFDHNHSDDHIGENTEIHDAPPSLITPIAPAQSIPHDELAQPAPDQSVGSVTAGEDNSKKQEPQPVDRPIGEQALPNMSDNKIQMEAVVIPVSAPPTSVDTTHVMGLLRIRDLSLSNLKKTGGINLHLLSFTPTLNHM